MTTRHLVDPELLPLVDMLSSQPVTYHEAGVPEMRAGLAAMVQGMPQVTLPEIEIEDRWTPASAEAHSVRIRLYRPRGTAPARAAVLYFHGGGYFLGTPEVSDARHQMLARDLGVVIASVDYRLAPEHRYPAAIEDGYAALSWLHHEAATLGIDRNRIAIIGDSAGGGIAAGLTLLARDRREHPVAFQLLCQPMLDDRTVVRQEQDPHRFVGEFVWTPEANRFGWTAYLGKDPGSDGIAAYAAAARAAELTDLPPTFIGIGALDLFLEENIEYARRLTRAGVPTEFHLYPGATHGLMSGNAEISRRANRDMTEALRQGLSIEP